MIIDCISDLHGHYPKLEGGDLLIVAGDLTARDLADEYVDEFQHWLDEQKYSCKVVVGGNHDSLLQKGISVFTGFSEEGQPTGEKVFLPIMRCKYLCDSGTEFEGLKIWGSPWTKTFEGMNPRCKAFTVDTDEELAEKWALIPDDVDILVTHSPPFHGPTCPEDSICEAYARLDRTVLGEHVGSRSLLKTCDPDAGLRLHVFGHVHEGYGHYHEKNPIFTIDLVNASHVNEHYQPVNKPIRIEL